ncbi:gliding motility-associated ABC transporter substrate-binding protein GldG [Owenweeksia hongkongensis]|uniref:gliding motility-associated ABC transporter substrate-binding protein GldG n=1 Tax=Owenweeksia hongkongensis TaxID=253245 RepID=UPI003A95793F
MKSRRTKDIINFLVITAIILVLNVIVSLKFFRIDLTTENRFSLSDATIDLLESFDDVMYIKVYLEGNFPADFQRLQRETRQMLDEFRAYNNKIEYEFIDPSASEDSKINQDVFEQLQYKGLKYYELRVNEKGGNKTQRVFPGALVTYGEKEVPVQLLMDQLGVAPQAQVNASVQNLEYTLANTIRGLVRQRKPLIGFLQGHDELDLKYVADFARSLSENYSVDKFNIRKFKSDSTGQDLSIMEQQRRLNRFDGLIIAKPQKSFNDLDKFLLDQYLMTGGKVLWLVDAIHANMDSLSESSQFISYPIYDRLNIQDMLFRYGVRINTNIVQDLVAGGVADRQGVYPWVYFPMIMPQSKNPITKDLSGIKLEFPSSIDTIIAKGVKKTFLLRSSQYSNVVATPHMVRLQTLYEPPSEDRFKAKGVPLAVLLEGKFESAFKNRLKPKSNGQEMPNLVEESQSTQMLVVADGDIIKNQLNIVNPNIPKGAPLPLGFDQFTQAQYGNKNFLLNAVDYMLDESGLIDIRSRELKIRLLDVNRINNNKLFWQLLNTVAPILIIFLFGVVYIYLRKRKYGKA